MSDYTEAECDAIDEEIADPKKIVTRERAQELMALLTGEIGDIQAQLEAARMEAIAVPLSAERYSWVRRAAYAANAKKAQRHAISRRERDLKSAERHQAATQPNADGTPNVKALKQERLKAEAEARKAKKAAEAAANHARVNALAAAGKFTNVFLAVAKERLSPDVFAELHDEAARRRTTMKAATALTVTVDTMLASVAEDAPQNAASH